MKTYSLVLHLLAVLVLTFVVGVTNASEAQRRRFDFYRVYELQPETIEQLAAVKSLESSSDIIFLDEVHYLNMKINVMVAPQIVPKFVASLRAAGVSYTLIESNAQSKLEGSDEVADPLRRSTDYAWSEYHELNDTYAWLHSLALQYPQQVTVFVAGQTYEGRQILGIKISFGKGRKGVFLEAGMHAREWIGPATVTYIAQQLLTSTVAEERWIAEKFDWYILPHANPDGYVYTHTTNRLWRKTRTPYSGNCYGADPNRNWDFHWNEVGASNNPCSDTYAGPTAFSEIETRTLANYIAQEKENIQVYISMHSYSQLLLFPYGHTSELPPNYKDLKRIFDAAVKGIKRRYGTEYTGGNIYDAIYPAAGASVDWAYGEVDVKYAFCYELRPKSTAIWTGFRLPAAQIIPTGEETLDSIVELLKAVGVKDFL